MTRIMMNMIRMLKPRSNANGKLVQMISMMKIMKTVANDENERNDENNELDANYPYDVTDGYEKC